MLHRGQVYSEANEPAGGGGGAPDPVAYIDDAFTNDDNVTTYVLSGSASWSFASGNGAEFDTGGAAVGIAIWDQEGNNSPADNADAELEWHSVAGSGANYSGRVYVLVRESGGDVSDAFYIETRDTTAKLAKLEADYGHGDLDEATVARIVAGDTLRIVVTPNGDNWDVKGYKNDVEILSAENVEHRGTLGRKTAYFASSISAGWDAVVKNMFAQSAA